MSDEIKRFLQKQFQKEADQIMREVEADEEVKNMEASSELDQKLYDQIERHVHEQGITEEERELIRLGRLYKRKQKNRKYVVLACTVVLAMAVGITSMGGPERVLKEFHRIVVGRDQVTLNSDDEKVTESKISTEEEAYQKIKDEFGFDPVRMLYLPDDLGFQEVVILRDIQNVQISYGDYNNRSLHYQISLNFQRGSTSFDVEDKVVQKFVVEVADMEIPIKSYEIEDNILRISALFEEDGVQYLIFSDGITMKEFEKIIKNLYFFSK